VAPPQVLTDVRRVRVRFTAEASGMTTQGALVDALSRAASPWASLYSDSPTLQTVVTFLHLASIFLAGGFAIATDRETLAAMNARVTGQMRHLAHLHSIHRPVLFGLVLAFASGLLLFAADVETFARSGVFWVKMLLLALLLANGYLLSRTEAALRTGQVDSPNLWGRLGYISYASMALWLAVILAGTLLINQA
jgi:hypothetical protein